MEVGKVTEIIVASGACGNTNKNEEKNPICDTNVSSL